eukprot:6961749-Prymnesium_polylepis.1
MLVGIASRTDLLFGQARTPRPVEPRPGTFRMASSGHPAVAPCGSAGCCVLGRGRCSVCAAARRGAAGGSDPQGAAPGSAGRLRNAERASAIPLTCAVLLW